VDAKVLGDLVDRLDAPDRLQRDLRLELAAEHLAFLLAHHKPRFLASHHLKSLSEKRGPLYLRSAPRHWTFWLKMSSRRAVSERDALP